MIQNTIIDKKVNNTKINGWNKSIIKNIIKIVNTYIML